MKTLETPYKGSLKASQSPSLNLWKPLVSSFNPQTSYTSFIPWVDVRLWFLGPSPLTSTHKGSHFLWLVSFPGFLKASSSRRPFTEAHGSKARSIALCQGKVVRRHHMRSQQSKGNNRNLEVMLRIGNHKEKPSDHQGTTSGKYNEI